MFRKLLCPVLQSFIIIIFFLFFSLDKRTWNFSCTKTIFMVHVYFVFENIYNHHLIEYSKQFSIPTNLNCRALTHWCVYNRYRSYIFDDDLHKMITTTERRRFAVDIIIHCSSDGEPLCHRLPQQPPSGR